MQEDRPENDSGENSDQDINAWPPGRMLEAEECIEIRCPTCEAPWRIDPAMAGHRIRCKCDSWLEVPLPESALQPATHQELAVDRPRPAREIDLSQPPSSFEHVPEVDVNVPLKPGALRFGRWRTRQRWINRATFELALVVAAFLAPSLFLFIFFSGREQMLYMPLSSFFSGLAVVLVGLFASHYTFEGLRWTMPKYFVEGILAGLFLATLAILYSSFFEQFLGRAGNPLVTLRETLGLGWTIILIGFFPAIFEEIAFRGLLQGRLSVLYGRTGGILLSGAAFALAHGTGLGLPFHMTGGFYLGWLRSRSNSLLPCILTHLLYNSTIVVALT